MKQPISARVLNLGGLPIRASDVRHLDFESEQVATLRNGMKIRMSDEESSKVQVLLDEWEAEDERAQ